MRQDNLQKGVIHYRHVVHEREVEGVQAQCRDRGGGILPQPGAQATIQCKKTEEIYPTLYVCINCSFFSVLMQYQAGQAEKQIKSEFERLHNVLVTEEALSLKALATEEDQKIAAINELVANTNKDIVTLKELIETLKKEMGNEDLAILRVKDLIPTNIRLLGPHAVLSVVFYKTLKNVLN